MGCKRIVSSVKIGLGGLSLSPADAQCTCRWSGTGRDRTLLERDASGRSVVTWPKPNHLVDASQLVELAETDRGAFDHGGLDRGIEAHHDLVLFELIAHLLDRFALDHGFQLHDDPGERRQ